MDVKSDQPVQHIEVIGQNDKKEEEIESTEALTTSGTVVPSKNTVDQPTTEINKNIDTLNFPKLQTPLQKLQNQSSVVKTDVTVNRTSAMGAGPPPGPRRSSSRSIKRPKFDDELVDTSAPKRSSSRKTSESSPFEPKLKRVLSKQSSHNPSIPLQPKKKIKKIKPSPVPTDFGRWRPTDDLSLITAVTQTCDLQTVHLAIRFSCNFTLKEIQDRWFALLYDPLVSRLAQQSMKALPSDVINQILKSALWSREEDTLLAEMSVDDKPTIEDFQKLLEANIDVFHRTRDAKHLYSHWMLLRHYQLLTCQDARNLPRSTQMLVSEMESKIIDDQIVGGEDDTLNQELSYADRCHKREIKRLEQEISQWEIMIEKSGLVEGLEVSQFKDKTLAILKGRILKYPMNKNKVTIGRTSFDVKVDIDLSIEGPSLKISRNQGFISYKNETFTLKNCGKRPFYVNGTPVSTGGSARLINNSVIEIYCVKLLFIVNPNLLASEDLKQETKPIVIQLGAETPSSIQMAPKSEVKWEDSVS